MSTTIHSVRLFDGESLHENAAVIFDTTTGLITSVSTDTSSLPSSSGGNTIDGTGHTLIPGLIDAHVHVHSLHLRDHESTANASQDEFRAMISSALKCGVTTICDMMTDLEGVERYRGWLEEEEQGNTEVFLPDLKTSVYGATVEGGWPKPIVLGRDPKPDVVEFVSKWPSLTPDNVHSFIESQLAAGADYIKLFAEDGCSMSFPMHIPDASPELQALIVQEAHDANLLAVGHATNLGSTTRLLNAHIDGLTHTFIDQPCNPDLISLYKQEGAFVIPTLVVLSSLTGEEQETRDRFATLASTHNLISDPVKQFQAMAIGAAAPKATVEHAYDTLRQFKNEGIAVCAGTDSCPGLPGTAIGPSLWLELYLYMSRCGYSGVEALRCATGVTARRFGFGDRGMVMEGKRADLVLLKTEGGQDILEDLSNGVGGAVVGVWKKGVKVV